MRPVKLTKTLILHISENKLYKIVCIGIYLTSTLHIKILPYVHLESNYFCLASLFIRFGNQCRNKHSMNVIDK